MLIICSYLSAWLLIILVWCCRQRTLPFLTLYKRWELKLRCHSVNISLSIYGCLESILCGKAGNSTSRKYNWDLFPFPINDLIEFKWSSGTISTSTRRRMASTKTSAMPCPSYIGMGDTSEKIQKICSPFIRIVFKISTNLCKSHLN